MHTGNCIKVVGYCVRNGCNDFRLMADLCILPDFLKKMNIHYRRSRRKIL